MKKFLLWVLLIILIGFLLLPPGLRLFGKDLYKEKEEEKKDVVTVLNCKKGEDSVNTTYFNDSPYDFRYVAKGNYTIENDSADNLDLENTFDNSIIYDIRNSSMVSYNSQSDTTEFHILLSSVELTSDKLSNYIRNPEKQKEYYTAMGFYCTISKV